MPTSAELKALVALKMDALARLGITNDSVALSNALTAVFDAEVEYFDSIQTQIDAIQSTGGAGGGQIGPQGIPGSVGPIGPPGQPGPPGASTDTSTITTMQSTIQALQSSVSTNALAVAGALASISTLQGNQTANQNNITSLQSGLTQAQQDINTLKQAGGATESVNGTTITPSSGTITDHAAAAWTIAGSLPAGGQPKKAGSNYGTVTTAVLGLYYKPPGVTAGTLYFKDFAGAWWIDNGTTLVANAAGDPRSPVTESPDPTTITPGGATLRLQNLTDTVSISAGGQVVIDGVTDTPTAAVDQGYYTGHLFYQRNPNFLGSGAFHWFRLDSINGSTKAGTYTDMGANVNPPGYVVSGGGGGTGGSLTPPPGAGTLSRWRTSTGVAAKDLARAWVCNQRVRINLEANTPWTLNPNYAVYKTQGVTGVRMFYYWKPNFNLDGAGTGQASIPPPSRYDPMLQAVTKALAAGMYVQVGATQVIDPSSLSGNELTWLKQAVTNFYTQAQIRAAADKWDMTRVAFQSVDEWGGTPGHAAINPVQLALYNIGRSFMGANAIMVINPQGWDGYDQLVNTGFQIPSDGGPIIIDVHRYPGRAAALTSGWATTIQNTVLPYSDSIGGWPIILSEWSPSNPDGLDQVNSDYPVAISAAAHGMPELRPCLFAVTVSSGTGSHAFNKSGSDPSLMDGTGGQADVVTAFKTADAYLLANCA
jgi:hypothetical protein